MELPSELVAIPDSPKPFRLLHLPSLAHDVIFSRVEIKDIYHLSKCSSRSRYAVKMFTRRQKYNFNIHARESSSSFAILDRIRFKSFYRSRELDSVQLPAGDSLSTYSEDVWAETKKEILYFLDVFTKKVNRLEFYDTSKITKMTEFLREKKVSPVDLVFHGGKNIINDEMYKYVLKEFKDAKKWSILASPSADFRFNDMEPFTGDGISILNADWLTVDNLTRCFTNVEKVRLWTPTRRYLKVPVLNQFLNAWRNGLRVGKLDLECECANFDLQSIFKNVPTTEVKRVELKYGKAVFYDGQGFLIRQEESGVEALVYFRNIYTFSNHLICFTTNFRLLRDDESDLGQIIS